jgi:hypothetical protein
MSAHDTVAQPSLTHTFMNIIFISKLIINLNILRTAFLTNDKFNSAEMKLSKTDFKSLSDKVSTSPIYINNNV